MDSEQKTTFWIIIFLATLYFIAFIFPNATGAQDEQMLFILSTDEHITYPWVMHMVTPAETTTETLRQWIAYQDYHYGYPFYLLSALIVLPFRYITGAFGLSQTQFHLLLLRQFINILPMIAAIILLVYLQTRFKGRLRSIGLFVFLASIMGVFRSQINWWHPDSLAILAVVLTFFYLDRDRLRFKQDFYLAAVTIGLAVGTKTIGFFFFLSIVGYLISGLIKHKIDLKQGILKGLLFIIIMAAIVIASNPLLLHGPTRQRYVATQSKSSYEMTHGWDDEDTYETGIASWMPYLEKWYGEEYFLVFAFSSLLAGCFWGPNKLLNRLILGWVIPYTIFLLFFVAIKPDHYWLPIILPLYSSLLSLTYYEVDGEPMIPTNNDLRASLASRVIALIAILAIFSQFTLNVITDTKLYNSAMIQERLLELNIHE
jgi:hypothetical protein